MPRCNGMLWRFMEGWSYIVGSDGCIPPQRALRRKLAQREEVRRDASIYCVQCKIGNLGQADGVHSLTRAT